MVATGSGGTAGDYHHILNRLPLARGQQFIQIFWSMKRVDCFTWAGDNQFIV